MGVGSKHTHTMDWSGEVTQLAECLPSMHKALGSLPQPICDLSTCREEAGVQSILVNKNSLRPVWGMDGGGDWDGEGSREEEQLCSTA